jgi:hypothetical protein
MRNLLALIAILSSVPSLAQESPPLPRERPESIETAQPKPAPIRPTWTIMATADGPVVPMPRPRPEEAEAPSPPAGPDGATDADTHGADADSPPALPAEPRVYQVACPAVLQGMVEAKALPPIADTPGAGQQCGAQSPLTLTGVLTNGRMVPLSAGVTTDCGVASVLPEWISDVDSYLKARENTQVAEVLVGTSYMCRNVNNASGGNLSFHAFADALDVTGFRLDDGRTITVEGDWADALSPEGRLLRYAHDAACSQFTTVLGPEANALHHDHFHVDLGCHGKSCTSRLCE